MAGYSEAGERYAIGCFRLDDIKEIERRMSFSKRMDLDEYMDDNRCMLIRYDSRIVLNHHEQFRLVDYQVGDGSVILWTAWMNED